MKAMIVAGILFLMANAGFAAEATTNTTARLDDMTTLSLALQKLPLTEQQKIDILIKTVEESGLKFIRNGSEYDSKAAGDHLRLKMRNSRGRIKTAQNFIKYIATGSSMSSKPYQLVMKDGTKVESAVWMTARLKELERMQAAAIKIQAARKN